MKRRQFLKFLGMVPVAVVVPGVLKTMVDPAAPYVISPDNFVSDHKWILQEPVDDGGFLVPEEFAE